MKEAPAEAWSAIFGICSTVSRPTLRSVSTHFTFGIGRLSRPPLQMSGVSARPAKLGIGVCGTCGTERNFMFRLTLAERIELVAKCDHLWELRFSHALPYAFTEHGAVMLNSPIAVHASIRVVRAFVRMAPTAGSCGSV